MIALFEAARELHLRQFAAFTEKMAASCTHGSAEVKLELSEDSKCHERFYCADFVINDEKREIREMSPAEVLNVAGRTSRVAGLDLSFAEMVWDDVTIAHDAGEVSVDLIEPWFVRWCDPDDVAPRPDGPFALTAHALMLSLGEIWVDLGTAPAGAMTELLDVLALAGATRADFDASRSAATVPAPSAPIRRE